MIFVEPSPCGQFVFGSALVILHDRIALLHAQRDIPKQNTSEGFNVALQGLASEVIAHLMSLAAQCGLNAEQIANLLDDAPEGPTLVRRRAS